MLFLFILITSNRARQHNEEIARQELEFAQKFRR